MYKLIRPPKFGNTIVTNEEKAPIFNVDDLKSIWGSTNNTYRSLHIQKVKERLDGLIETENWDCQLIRSDQDISGIEITECIIYYLCGFICRVLRKRFTCQTCLEGLQYSKNSVKNNSLTALIDVKTRGYLIYANINLFNLLNFVNKYFAENFYTSSSIYEDTISYVIENYNFTFPCNDHKSDVLSFILHYFVWLRMIQFTNTSNKNVTKNTTAKRKLSKLQKT